jgi:hypothetical protein
MKLLGLRRVIVGVEEIAFVHSVIEFLFEVGSQLGVVDSFLENVPNVSTSMNKRLT